MATYRIAVLPGDGIGAEVTAEAMRVLGVVAKEGGLGLELEEGLIGGAAIDAHGLPAAGGDPADLPGGRRDPVRGGGRPPLGPPPAGAAPGAGHPAHPQGAGSLREPPAGPALPHARRQLAAQADRSWRERISWSSASSRGASTSASRAASRASGDARARIQHDVVHRARDRADRGPGLPRRARAAAAADVGGQVERARRVAALARGRDGRGPPISGRPARPPAGGQLRHGARGRPPAVRHDRDREHLRRHPLGRGGDHRGVDGHAPVGQPRARSGATGRSGSTSRSTGRRRTSRARASPIRWPPSCRPRCCSGTRWIARPTPIGWSRRSNGPSQPGAGRRTFTRPGPPWSGRRRWPTG